MPSVEMATSMEIDAEDDEIKKIIDADLVKYNFPVLVNSVEKVSAKRKKSTIRSTSAENTAHASTSAAAPEISNETDEALNKILPSRTWTENGELWMQTVSNIPATRQDVINLQETLDMLLEQCQTRETGICPIRRELYTQCFDEIIRQVTINCLERGLLLLRVRDEIMMTIDAYETLYCSSIAFGMRKALQSQEGKEKLTEYVEQLEAEKKVLENTIAEMKMKNEQTERRNAELHAAEERKHSEEIAFLKKTNSQLKAQLEGIIAPKK